MVKEHELEGPSTSADERDLDNAADDTPDAAVTREKLNQALVQLRDVHTLNQPLVDFKNHPLPLARIKKIMKSDEDVRMISSEAPVLFAKACELFILEITHRAWAYSEANKRRTLQQSDLVHAICNHENEVFEFLTDNIPASAVAAANDGTANLAHTTLPSIAAAAGNAMQPPSMPSLGSTLSPAPVSLAQNAVSVANNPAVGNYMISPPGASEPPKENGSISQAPVPGNSLPVQAVHGDTATQPQQYYQYIQWPGMASQPVMMQTPGGPMMMSQPVMTMPGGQGLQMMQPIGGPMPVLPNGQPMQFVQMQPAVDTNMQASSQQATQADAQQWWVPRAPDPAPS